jgi:hypothetical protein
MLDEQADQLVKFSPLEAYTLVINQRGVAHLHQKLHIGVEVILFRWIPIVLLSYHPRHLFFVLRFCDNLRVIVLFELVGLLLNLHFPACRQASERSVRLARSWPGQLLLENLCVVVGVGKQFFSLSFKR